MLKGLLVSSIVLLSASLQAQFSMDFESGDRGVEQANCWQFGAVGYVNNSEKISGTTSARSNSMSNTSLNSSWIKTPWMIWNAGTVSFDARLINTTGDTKFIAVRFIPFDDADANDEGVYTDIEYQYDFVAIVTSRPRFFTSIESLSFPVPAGVQNGQPWKMMVSFAGTGGNNRCVTDNYVFPATYWADPSDGCRPIPLVGIADADGDGVDDADDQFPNDPNLAYETFYPADKNTFGTLAFEDMWPYMGDYDFNDLVVDYRLAVRANAQNKVQNAQMKFYVRAVGAEMTHGFGVEFNGIAPNTITSVTGYVLTDGIVSLSANGTESGQSNAVIIPFDNVENVINRTGGYFYNTQSGSNPGISDTVVIDIAFTGSLSTANFLAMDFNPFLIRNQVRGMEIHLPDLPPTNLANQSVLGTSSDDSGAGRYYKTSNNLPWALNIPAHFDYPKEQVDILDAYEDFAEWAQSAGQLAPDWYLEGSNGRVDVNIY